MKTVGSAKAGFKLSESAPELSDWGHTAYVTVEPEEHFGLGDDNELTIFFTPRKGTTFEQIEKLVLQLDEMLEKVHFNIFPNLR